MPDPGGVRADAKGGSGEYQVTGRDDRTSAAEEVAAGVLHTGMRAGVIDPADLAGLAWIGDDTSAGLRVQLRVLDRWLAEGDRVGGWKVGLTSRAVRDSMGQGFRPFGYIRSSRVFDSGTRLAAGDLVECSVEPELCWLVAEPLAGSPDPDTVRSALGGVSPAFEIVQRRLPAPAPKGIQLADDLKNWGLVVGPTCPLPDSEVSNGVLFTRDGEVLFSGRPDVIDDHYLSLSRICTTLARFGLGLQPGQRVITGSLAAPAPVRAQATFAATLERFGTVELRVGDSMA